VVFAKGHVSRAGFVPSSGVVQSRKKVLTLQRLLAISKRFAADMNSQRVDKGSNKPVVATPQKLKIFYR
jgi:hypothetical protein